LWHRFTADEENICVLKSLTDRLQQALSNAQSLAAGLDHTGIEAIHILASLLDEPANVSLLTQAGANIQTLQSRLRQAIADAPKLATPNGDINLTPQAVRILNLADSFAQKAGDDYIASEWALLALAEQGETKKIIEAAGSDAKRLRAVIEQVRGDSKVNSNNAEDQREALSKYTIDLTERALAGKLDPVIGRDDEIRRTIQVLARRTKNNPVLIGEPGVGKTAIVEGLAQRIITDCP